VGKNGVGERRRKTKTESVKEIRLHFPLVVSVTFPSRLFARCNFLFLPFYSFLFFFSFDYKKRGTELLDRVRTDVCVSGGSRRCYSSWGYDVRKHRKPPHIGNGKNNIFVANTTEIWKREDQFETFFFPLRGGPRVNRTV
jgi:hypothetical protein